MTYRSYRRTAAAGLFVLLCALSLNASTSAQSHAATVSSADGIHKIKHIVIIMQENRSFDSYFGTYPGADGIPMRSGTPSVCVPDRITAAVNDRFMTQTIATMADRTAPAMLAQILTAAQWTGSSRKRSAAVEAADNIAMIRAAPGTSVRM